ncbi:MAG: hypothetical protein KGJ78_12285 [Alphaproteobacteria bacterium]|nr:hypothetical protein [Alphaproteobacteria bacterium]
MDYKAKYFRQYAIDTNIALECRPLAELPWAELEGTGPIIVWLVPTVLREVDSKKRDGRLGSRSREFNRLASQCIDQSVPITIVRGPPQVDVAICSCRRIDWELYSDLDRAENDDRIVAELLNANEFDATSITLLSFDTNPRAKCKNIGIAAHRPSEAWLLSPEPSPQEKELQRLKSRLAVLEKTEPILRVRLDILAMEPVELVRIEALTVDERNALRERVLNRNPQIRQSDDVMSSVMGSYDPGYDGKYKKFVRDFVENYVAKFSENLEKQVAQIPAVIEVENTGEIRAENLIIEITSSGVTFNDKVIVYPIGGPNAPKPSRNPVYMPPIRLLRGAAPVHVDRHEIELAVEPRRSSSVRAQCQDFRHGQKWERVLVLTIDPRAEAGNSVCVRTTAANMHGEVVASREIQTSVRDVRYSDVVELESSSYKLDFPVKDFIREALKAREFDELEFERFGENEED